MRTGMFDGFDLSLGGVGSTRWPVTPLDDDQVWTLTVTSHRTLKHTHRILWVHVGGQEVRDKGWRHDGWQERAWRKVGGIYRLERAESTCLVLFLVWECLVIFPTALKSHSRCCLLIIQPYRWSSSYNSWHILSILVHALDLLLLVIRLRLRCVWKDMVLFKVPSLIFCVDNIFIISLHKIIDHKTERPGY